MGAGPTGTETLTEVGVVVAVVVVGVVVSVVVVVLGVQADTNMMADIMIVEIANEIIFFPFILNLLFKIASNF
jgi:hypothetical protein